MAQFIIFLLGWPLEWSEIIIIFVPIFLPLLDAFGVDPLFFGILVALNLQTSFLTPPMAMSCYYLKGIAPPHVQLTTIFKGALPFLVPGDGPALHGLHLCFPDHRDVPAGPRVRRCQVGTSDPHVPVENRDRSDSPERRRVGRGDWRRPDYLRRAGERLPRSHRGA
jgi:hypothetical protein